MDYERKETAEVKLKRSVSGTIGILQASLNSKTVKRVVYCSSISAIFFNDKDIDILDESFWSNVEHIQRNFASHGFSSYAITKTLTEKAALEFAEKNGLDVVSILPSWVNGPFITPFLPHSVSLSMDMIFGNQEGCHYFQRTSFVHTDDVVRAHISLFENPDAKGRYICSAVGLTIDVLSETLAVRYPGYPIPSAESLKQITRFVSAGFSSKKLLDTGFKFNHGIEQMFDYCRIECCKQKGFL